MGKPETTALTVQIHPADDTALHQGLSPERTRLPLSQHQSAVAGYGGFRAAQRLDARRSGRAF